MIGKQLDAMKTEISSALSTFLTSNIPVYSRFKLDSTLLGELLSYTVSGKMYRGAILVLVADSLTDKKYHRDAVILAGALELLQAGILIQDDVMDQDDCRRGRPAIHSFVANLPHAVPTSINKHFSESTATCVGDVAYFLAFNWLTEISVPSDRKCKIMSLFAREMTLLALSQTEDMRLAATNEPIIEDDILSMYSGKTSGYTWILPLLVAVEFSGQQGMLTEHFKKLGDAAGIVYQLQDDTLGLFGSEKEIGKPVGSDIREGKKTPFMLYAFTHASNDDIKLLRQAFGNYNISPNHISSVHAIMDRCGAINHVNTLIEKYIRRCHQIITTIPVDSDTKKLLTALIDYISYRKK